MKKKDKITFKDYRYEDPFKEDLIHQLYHLVEEMKGIREELKKLTEPIKDEYVECLATKTDIVGMTELIISTMHQMLKPSKPSNKAKIEKT